MTWDNYKRTRLEHTIRRAGLGDKIDYDLVDHNLLLNYKASEHLAITYGEIYAHDNTASTEVSSSGWAQVLSFDTNGASSGVTPSQAEDHLTIVTTGVYFASISAAVENAAGATHVVELSVFINNGNTEKTNIHAHRTLAAATDKGSISLSGIANFTAGDTVELWATTDRWVASDIILSDITMSLIRLV